MLTSLPTFGFLNPVERLCNAAASRLDVQHYRLKYRFQRLRRAWSGDLDEARRWAIGLADDDVAQEGLTLVRIEKDAAAEQGAAP